MSTWVIIGLVFGGLSLLFLGGAIVMLIKLFRDYPDM